MALRNDQTVRGKGERAIGEDALTKAWNQRLKRNHMGRNAGLPKAHRDLIFGRIEVDRDSSLYGQETYAFPGLDPQSNEIEAVRLLDILHARKQVYRKLGARVRPYRCTPRRSLKSGPGVRVDMVTGQRVGTVPASSNFREDERNCGKPKLNKIGVCPVFATT